MNHSVFRLSENLIKTTIYLFLLTRLDLINEKQESCLLFYFFLYLYTYLHKYDKVDEITN